MQLLLLLLLPALLLAADWHAGTGGNPQRNGMTGEFGPDGSQILWNESLPSQFAQPAVIEGNIAVMSRTFNIVDPLHGTLMVAHDLETGDTLWTAELPVDFPATDWRSHVLAIRDGRVYASRSGNTNYSYYYALDAQTGEFLWQSEDSLDDSSTESPAFADNGDLIVGGFTSLERIDATTGGRVWRTPRTSPTSGGSEAAVFGARAYLWEASGTGPKISVFNIETGARLYSSRGIGGGFVQQVSPFVGPDGTIYAPRTQNNPVSDSLVAFEDNGSALVELWRVPLGFVAFATFGIGPDGSVYSYSREMRVLRLDPATGETLDSSEVIQSDFYQPRMAVDTAGVVFLTNGGFSQGRLYSFDANLQALWDEDFPNVNIGSPAIGRGGHMIVCGTGTDVRCWAGRTPNAAPQRPVATVQTASLAQNYPNPFNASTLITYELGAPGHILLAVYDALGRHVKTLVDAQQAAGQHTVHFDGTGLASGAYYCRMASSHETQTVGMILLK